MLVVRYGFVCSFIQSLEQLIWILYLIYPLRLCLMQFAASHGLRNKFLSDNGKTFKATATYIGTIFKDKTVQDYLTNKGNQ